VAIAVFFGVNLAQASARIFLTTEPNVARAAADVWASRDPKIDPTIRTYTQPLPLGIRTRYLGVSDGFIDDLPPVGKYYVYLQRGIPEAPHGLFDGSFSDWIVTYTGPTPKGIAKAAQANPKLSRIILWEQFLTSTAMPEKDTYLEALGSSWKLASSEVLPTYVHWTWEHHINLRRREYVRVGPNPTTARGSLFGL
jgi:hypothetical protein